jgi:hypothetical protein
LTHPRCLPQLWSRLEAHCGQNFNDAKVIFLGDYVDRGPDTRGVLDWLCSLRQRHPAQQHVFLAGNHDFALAAFLGLVGGFDGAAADVQAAGYEPWRENEGPLYAAPDAAGMHLQGRRYATRIGWDEHSVFSSEACVPIPAWNACARRAPFCVVRADTLLCAPSLLASARQRVRVIWCALRAA